MSETPGGPEYYTPAPDAAPPLVPEPPSIHEAAAQFGSPQWNSAPAGSPPKAGLAITALVLGVVGVVTGWIPLWGLLVGVAAIICGSIALAKRQSKGMAISGVVLGAVSALMSILVGIFVYIGLGEVSDDEGDYFTYGPAGAGQTTLGPESVDGGLAVVEQSFGKSKQEDGSWWFVVVLDNPSDAMYPATDVTVQALDADGNVIDDWWNYLSLPSGRSAVTGFFWELPDTGVASLVVLGPAADGVGPDAQVGTVEIGDLTAATDDLWTVVSGTATSTLERGGNGGIVTVVARDESGAIVGGAQGYLDPLDANAQAPFDAYFTEALPESTRYEAYWVGY